MRVLQMPGLGQVAVADVPMPRPQDGQVLLKMRGAAMFRSEFVPLLRGADPRTREGNYLYHGFPFDFSADIVASVAELGPGAEGISIGPHVLAIPRPGPTQHVKQRVLVHQPSVCGSGHFAAFFIAVSNHDTLSLCSGCVKSPVA